MRALLLSTFILAACSRREAKVGPDKVDSALPLDAAVTEAPLDRFMVGARIVDVPSRSIAHELQKKPPTFAEVDRDRAYVVFEGVVRAYDSKTGAEKWKVTPPRCRQFAMTDHAVYCAGDDEIHVLGKTDGALRTIATGKPIGSMLGLSRHLIVFRATSELESIAEGDAGPLATIKAPLHSYRGMVRHGDGVCGAAASVKGGVFAGCWTATLTAKWTKSIVIAKPGDPVLTGYDARRLDHGFLIASSLPWGSGPDRAVVVRWSDGDEVARVDESVAAVAARNERELDGLVSLKKGLRYLATNGTLRWSAPKLRVEDSADALLDGERVLVATYPQISSGVTLYALDRTSGALLWTHGPPLPGIAHSAYMNEVSLSFIGKTLVMRGHEAGIEHASLLEAASGKAHLNTALALWGP